MLNRHRGLRCVNGCHSLVRAAPIGLAALTYSALAMTSALATPPVVAPPSSSADQTGADQTSQATGFNTGLSRRSNLLGDLFGIRKELSKHGISLNISETSEVLGNVSGGFKRGAAYDGLTQISSQLDTQRAWKHYGGTFNASILQIHGSNLSAANLGTIQTASGIESDRATRLWELWYQQKFLAEDRLDIKIGQQSLDQEFMGSQNANVFVNTMFGWAAVPSYDLPGGGPAYPLSALGVRVRARPTNSVTLLGGIYNGSPVRDNSGDPQRQNRYGTSFPLSDGALAIAEAQFAYPALGSMVYAGKSGPMPRVYKIGAYYDTEKFADERFDDTGVSLANPASSGNARQHRGNVGFYGVADRMLWISPRDADRTLSVFGRAMTQPQSDRNFLNYSLNAGFVLRDPIPRINRDDDTFGVGFGFTKVSSDVAAADRATAFFSGAPNPARTNETFAELTYQYQYTPWCQIQPDFQYVFHPGGGILDGNGKRVRNEAVLGVRVNLLF